FLVELSPEQQRYFGGFVGAGKRGVSFSPDMPEGHDCLWKERRTRAYASTLASRLFQIQPVEDDRGEVSAADRRWLAWNNGVAAVGIAALGDECAELCLIRLFFEHD